MPDVRQSMTIYIRWENPVSNLIKPFRRVLTNCFVSEQGNVITEKTGVVLHQSTFAQIFKQPDLSYIPPHEWEKLTEDELDGKWTIILGTTNSFIVNHVVEHEFDFGPLSEITQQEDIFINATPGAARIASVQNGMKGTERAQHMYVRY